MNEPNRITAREALKLFDDLAAQQPFKRHEHGILQDATLVLAACIARDEKAADGAVATPAPGAA